MVDIVFVECKSNYIDQKVFARWIYIIYTSKNSNITLSPEETGKKQKCTFCFYGCFNILCQELHQGHRDGCKRVGGLNIKTIKYREILYDITEKKVNDQIWCMGQFNRECSHKMPVDILYSNKHEYNISCNKGLVFQSLPDIPKVCMLRNSKHGMSM